MLPIYCKQCGTEITKDKRTGRRFCSQRCFGDYFSKTRKGIPRPEVAGPKPDRQKRVTKICEKCGKEFEVKQSHAERRKRCSKECQREQRTLECDFCHKPYSVKLAEVERSHYCSKSCYHEGMKQITGPSNPRWKRVDVSCAYCDTIIHIVPSQIKDKGNFFCDSKCYGKWISENKNGKNANAWRGGQKKWRGPNWQAQRKLALERDNYKCQHCGITQKKLGRFLDVHHIVPFRLFGISRYVEANDLLNLICLCQQCHMQAEHNMIPIQPRLV